MRTRTGRTTALWWRPWATGRLSERRGPASVRRRGGGYGVCSHEGVGGLRRAMDATGDNAIEPEAREAQRRLAAVVSCSSDAILTKSAHGIITSWNAAAARLYGYAAVEAIGRPISLLVPARRRGEERQILRQVFGGENRSHYETERVRKDGREVVVSISVSPVRDEEGRVVEAAVIARDVSAMRRTERHRERLQAVSAALSEAVAPDDVVDAVLGERVAAVQADAAVIALIEPGQARLRLLGMRGYPPELAARMEEITVDAPVPLAEVLRTGEPVWIDEPGEAHRRFSDADRFELERESDVAALPLVVHRRTIGGLWLRFHRVKRVDAEDRDFMVALAQQCAQALERARLFAAERQARQRAEEARRRAEYLAQAGE